MFATRGKGRSINNADKKTQVYGDKTNNGNNQNKKITFISRTLAQNLEIRKASNLIKNKTNVIPMNFCE